jgi:hypothetical protein
MNRQTCLRILLRSGLTLATVCLQSVLFCPRVSLVVARFTTSVGLAGALAASGAAATAPIRCRCGINPVPLWHHASEPVPSERLRSKRRKRSRPFIALYPEIYMPTPSQDMKTVIPDLRDVTLDQLEELGSTPLAHAVALYRERLMKNGVPLSSFNARI